MLRKSFKEVLEDVKAILRPGCYGAIIDLSDAYYHIKSRKYTRLIFDGKVIEYTYSSSNGPYGLRIVLAFWSRGVRAPAVALHMLVEANVSGN
jgi:hypothetical protein